MSTNEKHPIFQGHEPVVMPDVTSPENRAILDESYANRKEPSEAAWTEWAKIAAVADDDDEGDGDPSAAQETDS